MIARLRPCVALAVLLLAGCLPGGPPAPTPARPTLVDDVAAARLILEQERTAARLASAEAPARRVLTLIDLGLFQDADSLLAATTSRALDLALAEAELRFRQYRFDEAQALVTAVLEQQPRNRTARLLSIRLSMEAWQLDWAAEQASAFLGRGRRDAEAALLLGRIHLLRRDYDAALEWSERARSWGRNPAAAALLAADVYLWREQHAEAEQALRQALALDPFDADARFAYGYALWRRGVPALLTAMNDQWELALELDPLHLETHWHLGNGHTPLTYADYAAVADSAARLALAPVDSFIVQGALDQAVAHTRQVEAEMPGSVLPALWRGSAYYLLGDRSTTAAMDSALASFRTILSTAPGFGPAHNGVAAVLKQRQFRALAAYDSLEAAIALTPVSVGADLHEIFPDLWFYPAERVGKMVTQQLGPALAFLPFLRRQEQRVYIPPLHRDLATATGDASFRTAATFDHRRWMDIRGVGGSRVAAAGIEYLERGSHLERGVLLHEFVHLVHASALTDAQRRRVRELYLRAMEEERTLDYYAASNDQEFLAQAVEAYLSPAKAHPLNHKSMNTREDLRRLDPETFSFVEGLVGEMERALAGDPGALRSNRAEMYVNLARAARDGELSRQYDLERAAVLLDSALVHDRGYLPAMVEYATLEGERGRLARAAEWLSVAEGIDPTYTPILRARAELLALDGAALPGTGDTRVALLRRAAEQETDPWIRAEYVRDVWELQAALGRIPEAIATAEVYASSGPVVSTRLREAREEAAVAAARMRAKIGYAEDAVTFLRERVAAAPLDFNLLGHHADALTLAGMTEEAVQVLEEARQVLSAAGDAHAGVHLRLAELRLAAGDTSAAHALVDPLLDGEKIGREEYDGRLVRLLISIGESTEAQRQLAALPEGTDPGYRAEHGFTRGWISAWRGDLEMAERLYREALAADPYNLQLRVALHRLLAGQGRQAEAQQVADSAATLPLPLGPAFWRVIESG